VLNLEKKKYIILFALGIFILSLGVRLYPSLHRDNFYAATINLLGISKNLAISGQYSTDNEKSVVLAPGKIPEEGVRSHIGNNLTTLFYGEIFKFSGFKPEIPFYLSIVLFAVSNVLLFLLVLRLFNIKLALLVSVLDIFMPFVSQGANKSGYYEFAMVFLFIAFLFYLDKNRVTSKARLVLTGLFFGLAAVCRNAFFVSFVPLVIFDFYKERSMKRLVLLVLPFVILAGIFWAPAYLNVTNDYTYMLFSERTRFDGHIFPDPYTFHFEKDEHLQALGYLDEPDNESFMEQYGVKTPMRYKLYSYYFSAKYYITRSFRLINFGGPLMLLIIVLGAVALYRRRKDLVKFFLLWIGFLYFVLIVLKTNNWDHFLEIRFPLVLLAGVGVYWIVIKISGGIKDKRLKYLAIGFILLGVVSHLFYANKWLFHDLYRNSFLEKTPMFSQVIEEAGVGEAGVGEDDVIAMSYEYQGAYYLNYYTGKSFIYFDSETISRLLTQGKLGEAFDFYGVTVMLGSNQEQLEEIQEQTKVRTIYVDLD